MSSAVPAVWAAAEAKVTRGEASSRCVPAASFERLLIRPPDPVRAVSWFTCPPLGNASLRSSAIRYRLAPLGTKAKAGSSRRTAGPPWVPSARRGETSAALMLPHKRSLSLELFCGSGGWSLPSLQGSRGGSFLPCLASGNSWQARAFSPGLCPTRAPSLSSPRRLPLCLRPDGPVPKAQGGGPAHPAAVGARLLLLQDHFQTRSGSQVRGSGSDCAGDTVQRTRVAVTGYRRAQVTPFVQVLQRLLCGRPALGLECA